MIGAIILGILAGYLGRAIMPGKQEMGFFKTALLGIVGALAGFFVFTEILGIGDSEAFDLGGLPGAVIGVIIVLFIYDRVSR
ncbi:MAG: GlsB/YeaQ/YmgE family stress response membrane protein [Actinobacteria bacterium]|nr:GlsB/YeaQ/YmgE family stress response membrane protein [Actinomycetota bacterium]